MLSDAQQLVRHCDGVHVGLLAIVEVSIWSPDPLQHLDAEAQVLDGSDVAQPRVPPGLAEVAVHRVVLGNVSGKCMYTVFIGK